MPDTDHVVLLDDDGNPIGTAPKSSVHGPDTALHLAFSCHVLNSEGQVLLTRRALSKRTWPGVWTNSFCGHPRPAEPVLSAVRGPRDGISQGPERGTQLHGAVADPRQRPVDGDLQTRVGRSGDHDARR